MLGPNPVLGGYQRYFDPSQFVLPPPGFLGNLGRNTLIGPGLNTFDLSLGKTIPIVGDSSLQVRAEFYNLFNTTNLQAQYGGGRVGNALSATFGSIQTARPGTQGELGVKFAW